MSAGDSNLWLFVDMLARRRGLILTLTILAAVISIAVSFLLPAWYEAEAVLLPPQEQATAIGSNQLSGVYSLTEGLTLPIMVTPSDVFARMLRSRRISEGIIKKHQLMERYGTSGWLETHDVLASHTRISVTDEGLVTIAVEDMDPQQAAEIANDYVAYLNSLNAEILVSRAQRSLDFITDRLKQVEDELSSARLDIEGFQTEHKAIDFDEQTKLAIEQAIALKIQLASVELEIELGREVLGSDNPEMQDRLRRRAALQDQLRQLEEGGADSSYFSVPVAAIPSLRGQYRKLYSRVEVNERLYNILLEQVEQARISQKEQTPTVSVLDSARVPEIRSRPKRSLIVVASTGLTLLFAILLAAVIDFLSRLQSERPKDYTRVARFLRAYLGWIPGIRVQIPEDSRDSR